MTLVRLLKPIKAAEPGKGDFNGMISAIEDVTERRKAEDALRKKTQLLEQITDNMFDMVSVSNLEGTYTFAGKSHERILGYTTEELIGKNVMDFVHPDEIGRAHV